MKHNFFKKPFIAYKIIFKSLIPIVITNNDTSSIHVKKTKISIKDYLLFSALNIALVSKANKTGLKGLKVHITKYMSKKIKKKKINFIRAPYRHKKAQVSIAQETYSLNYLILYSFIGLLDFSIISIKAFSSKFLFFETNLVYQ